MTKQLYFKFDMPEPFIPKSFESRFNVIVTSMQIELKWQTFFKKINEREGMGPKRKHLGNPDKSHDNFCIFIAPESIN